MFRTRCPKATEICAEVVPIVERAGEEHRIEVAHQEPGIVLIEAGWAVDADAAADPETRRAELIDEYTERFANPYSAAERGYVDDVIDPRDTRTVLGMCLSVVRNRPVAGATGYGVFRL